MDERRFCRTERERRKLPTNLRGFLQSVLQEWVSGSVTLNQCSSWSARAAVLCSAWDWDAPKKETRETLFPRRSAAHIRQTQTLFPLGDQPVSNLARDKSLILILFYESVVYMCKTSGGGLVLIQICREQEFDRARSPHTLLLISSTNDDPQQPTLSNTEQSVFTTSFIALRYWFEGVVMAPAPASS